MSGTPAQTIETSTPNPFASPASTLSNGGKVAARESGSYRELLMAADVALPAIPGALNPPSMPRADDIPAWLRVVARFAKRLPSGALLAIALVAFVHAVVAAWIITQPVARPEIRRKAITLTKRARPRLIVAGDSRGLQQLQPVVMAGRLGLAARDAVNLAGNICDTTTAWATYSEFAERFARHPVMVLSVSPWSVNDQTQTITHDAEILLAMSWRERLKLLPPKIVALSLFLPERRLLERLAVSFEEAPKPDPRRGFLGQSSKPSGNFTDEAIQRQFELLKLTWYRGPAFRGFRWRRMERDVTGLMLRGVQVVLFCGPFHPKLRERMRGTPEAAAQREFDERLARFASRANVPLIRYEDTEWCPDCNPDEVFFDAAHVNRRGAEVLSRCVANELRVLMAQGVIRLRAGSSDEPAP